MCLHKSILRHRLTHLVSCVCACLNTFFFFFCHFLHTNLTSTLYSASCAQLVLCSSNEAIVFFCQIQICNMQTWHKHLIMESSNFSKIACALHRWCNRKQLPKLSQERHITPKSEASIVLVEKWAYTDASQAKQDLVHGHFVVSKRCEPPAQKSSSVPESPLVYHVKFKSMRVHVCFCLFRCIPKHV